MSYRRGSELISRAFLQCPLRNDGAMRLAVDPFRLLLISRAGWLNPQQQDVIDYLQEEDRGLREWVVGSAEVRAFCVPLRLFLVIPLYPTPFIGGQQHAVHRQPARRGDRALNAARVIVYARPRPLLRPAHQPCLHRIPMGTLPLRCTPSRGAEHDPSLP
jgi:hypothetical protein